jgi:TP53 regulating kinase and related kinases
VYKHLLHENGPYVLLKHRFPKGYRHPTLDASLTKQRIGAEARALARCQRFGVAAPLLRFVDLEGGTLALEWVDGLSVRDALGGPSADLSAQEDASSEAQRPAGGVDESSHSLFSVTLSSSNLTQPFLVAVMERIGIEIAKLHRADIIHGDLTTSNMMLRQRSSPLGIVGLITSL